MNFYIGTQLNKRLRASGPFLEAFNTLWYTFLLVLFVSIVTALVLYKVILFNSEGYLGSFWVLYGILVSLFLVSRIPYAYLYEDKHVSHQSSEYPSVSVIIAAKDEEDGIYQTIQTCLESGYPGTIECIVVNDGSTDNTGNEIERAKLQYAERLQYLAFEKNGGKKEAIAAGLALAKHDVFVFVDSDSYVKPGAITHVVEHLMDDPTVGAVAGNTKVENRDHNIMTRVQAIHYAVSFDIYKTAESVHHSVTCCPGCFSAYRREAVMPLIEEWRNQKFLGMKGNYGDDRSLTNFVLKSWGVVYCQKAQATTKVPEYFKKYWKQQLRWKKSWLREGILAGQHMWKGRNPLASLAFYIHFTFPFIGPLIALKVLLLTLSSGNIQLLLVFIASFIAIGMVFSLFVRIYRSAEYFYYMPLFSLMYIFVFIWQMPIAMLTIRNLSWGTR